MSGIDYSEKIPNNVNLANDRTLQRALEHWQPRFLEWWRELGPSDFASAMRASSPGVSTGSYRRMGGPCR